MNTENFVTWEKVSFKETSVLGFANPLPEALTTSPAIYYSGSLSPTSRPRGENHQYR